MSDGNCVVGNDAGILAWGARCLYCKVVGRLVLVSGLKFHVLVFYRGSILKSGLMVAFVRVTVFSKFDQKARKSK